MCWLLHVVFHRTLSHSLYTGSLKKCLIRTLLELVVQCLARPLFAFLGMSQEPLVAPDDRVLPTVRFVNMSEEGFFDEHFLYGAMPFYGASQDKLGHRRSVHFPQIKERSHLVRFRRFARKQRHPGAPDVSILFACVYAHCTCPVLLCISFNSRIFPRGGHKGEATFIKTC